MTVSKLNEETCNRSWRVPVQLQLVVLAKSAAPLCGQDGSGDCFLVIPNRFPTKYLAIRVKKINAARLLICNNLAAF